MKLHSTGNKALLMHQRNSNVNSVFGAMKFVKGVGEVGLLDVKPNSLICSKGTFCISFSILKIWLGSLCDGYVFNLATERFETISSHNLTLIKPYHMEPTAQIFIVPHIILKNTLIPVNLILTKLKTIFIFLYISS